MASLKADPARSMSFASVKALCVGGEARKKIIRGVVCKHGGVAIDANGWRAVDEPLSSFSHILCAPGLSLQHVLSEVHADVKVHPIVVTYDWISESCKEKRQLPASAFHPSGTMSSSSSSSSSGSQHASPSSSSSSSAA